MSMPPIAPTGAMSSGDYCAYMVGYCAEASEQMLEELSDYVAQSTIDDWDKLWVRSLTDVGGSITELEAEVRQLRAQATMVSDAIKKL